jgi:predicted nuclease of restriction endonuclease-like (RecB) superfamily
VALRYRYMKRKAVDVCVAIIASHPLYRPRFAAAIDLLGPALLASLTRKSLRAVVFEETLPDGVAVLIKRAQRSIPEDQLTAEEEIKDPMVLEFLGLNDEYSESALEDALIHRLEQFLLELGNDFSFVARQKRLRVGDEWYRVDLLFFQRRLRCLVIIDLKIGRFAHADAGQMSLYLNYAREHWTLPGKNPPIGLILSSEKNEAVAHYALGNLRNKVLSSEYKLALPDEKKLAEEIARTRKSLMQRKL